MRPGQASVELLTIMGIMLLSILFFAIFASDTLAGERQQQEIRAARSSVQQLAASADYVFSQGEGAYEFVLVALPPSVAFDPNRTYVGKPASAPSSATPDGININIYGNDIFARTRAPLAGAFPSATGTYLLKVESHGSFVGIGSELAEPGQAEAALKMKKNQQRYVELPIRSAFDYPVLINVSAQWGHISPILSFSPSYFTLYRTSLPVRLNFTTGPADAGLYPGSMAFTASVAGSNGTMATTFSVPISVEVQD